MSLFEIFGRVVLGLVVFAFGCGLLGLVFGYTVALAAAIRQAVLSLLRPPVVTMQAARQEPQLARPEGNPVPRPAEAAAPPHQPSRVKRRATYQARIQEAFAASAFDNSASPPWEGTGNSSGS